jgi:hypothetical protein
MAPARRRGANNKAKDKSQLSLGDLVLAKVKGFPLGLPRSASHFRILSVRVFAHNRYFIRSLFIVFLH